MTPTKLLAWLGIPLGTAAFVAALCWVVLYGGPSTPESTARADSPSPAGARASVGDRYEVQEKLCDAATGRKLTYAGPSTMWPPDRRRREAPVVAAGGTGPVELTTQASSGTGSEILTQRRDGAVSTTHALRPKQAGLTYTITATARWTDGRTCTGRFTAKVPHSG